MLVGPWCDFEAVDQATLAEAQSELVRTGFDRLIAGGAEPGFATVVERVFDRMPGLLGRPADHQQAVGRHPATFRRSRGEVGR